MQNQHTGITTLPLLRIVTVFSLNTSSLHVHLGEARKIHHEEAPGEHFMGHHGAT
jgi:hypothetical protein